MKYEDFVRGELGGLESYLALKLSANREVGPFSRTRRTASCENWRQFFTAEDVALLRPVSGQHLATMGYTGWQLQEVERLNSEHFSEYVVRLIREARAAS